MPVAKARNIYRDKAKKEFLINNKTELKKIQKKYIRRSSDGRVIRPNFFAHLAKSKGYYDPKKKNYMAHDTTMDYLQQVVRSRLLHMPKQRGKKFLRFDQIFDRGNYDVHRVIYEQVRRVISLLNDMQSEIIRTYTTMHPNISPNTKTEKFYALRLLYESCAQYIGRMKFSYSTMVYLLMCIEKPNQKRISRNMFYMLFGFPNTSFYKAIQVSATNMFDLEECKPDTIGAFQAYNYWFRHKKHIREPIPANE